VWDSPGRDGSTTRPRRSGRVVHAADGPQPPFVASLLPLAVRAGALAFGGLAVRRVGPDSGRGPAAAVRARPERVRAPPRPALPTAMRHETGLPQPWASRRVERGRGDAQGEGIREAPLAGYRTGRFVLAARHGWRAVLRCSGLPSAGGEAPRWISGRDCPPTSLLHACWGAAPRCRRGDRVRPAQGDRLLPAAGAGVP
jgi:hypothetical protein